MAGDPCFVFDLCVVNFCVVFDLCVFYSMAGDGRPLFIFYFLFFFSELKAMAGDPCFVFDFPNGWRLAIFANRLSSYG
jgi:hypothetical protein